MVPEVPAFSLCGGHEVVKVRCVDGRVARVHVGDLTIAGDTVVVTGDTFERHTPIGAVEITDAIGTAPRLVRFSDGACCEAIDRTIFDEMLLAHGLRPSRLAGWERSPAGLAASLLALVLVLTLAYRIALPAMAGVVAGRLPDPAVQQLSRHTLLVLDRTVFQPTDVPMLRRADLALAFTRLQFPPDRREPSHEIVFRKAAGIGPNAFALPSGTIVVLDALVALAQDDREIVSVLAHETGHVVHRHGQRLILQKSAIALAIAFFLGDMTAVAAGAPTALLQSKYSRDFEREADDYAVAVLRRSGISTNHLAAILERLETAQGGGRDSSTLDYLSTHPATAERLARLRSQ